MNETHVVLVGPIRGDVTLADGTVVDVRPDPVYVDSAEKAAEVAHLVAQRYVAEGHPSHDPGEAFVYNQEA